MAPRSQKQIMQGKFLKIFQQKSQLEIHLYITDLFKAYKKSKNRDQSTKNLDEMKKFFCYDEEKGMQSNQLEKQIQLFVLYLERNNFLQHFELIIQNKMSVEDTFNTESIYQFLKENNQDLAVIEKVLDAVKKNTQVKKIETDQDHSDDSETLSEYINSQNTSISLFSACSSSPSNKSSKIESSNNFGKKKSQNQQVSVIKSHQEVKKRYPDIQDDQENDNYIYVISSNSGKQFSIYSESQEHNLSKFGDKNQRQNIYCNNNPNNQQKPQKELDLEKEKHILVDKGQNKFQIKKQKQNKLQNQMSEQFYNYQQKSTKSCSLQQNNYSLLEKQMNPVQKKMKLNNDGNFEKNESQKSHQSSFLNQDSSLSNKETKDNQINQFYRLQNMDKQVLEVNSEQSIGYHSDESCSLSSDSDSNDLSQQSIKNTSDIYSSLSSDSDSSELSQQTLLDINNQLDNQLTQKRKNKENIQMNFQILTEIRQMLTLTNQQKQNTCSETCQLIQTANNFYYQTFQKDLTKNDLIISQNLQSQRDVIMAQQTFQTKTYQSSTISSNKQAINNSRDTFLFSETQNRANNNQQQQYQREYTNLKVNNDEKQHCTNIKNQLQYHQEFDESQLSKHASQINQDKLNYQQQKSNISSPFKGKPNCAPRESDQIQQKNIYLFNSQQSFTQNACQPKQNQISQFLTYGKQISTPSQIGQYKKMVSSNDQTEINQQTNEMSKNQAFQEKKSILQYLKSESSVIHNQKLNQMNYLQKPSDQKDKQKFKVNGGKEFCVNLNKQQQNGYSYDDRNKLNIENCQDKQQFNFQEKKLKTSSSLDDESKQSVSDTDTNLSDTSSSQQENLQNFSQAYTQQSNSDETVNNLKKELVGQKSFQELQQMFKNLNPNISNKGENGIKQILQQLKDRKMQQEKNHNS
ncbi:hypothetical protein ABPG74_005837 [Tetrahymena malaccensis]